MEHREQIGPAQPGDVEVLEVIYFENRKHRVRITYALDIIADHGPARWMGADPSVYVVELTAGGTDFYRDWYSAKVRTVTAARAAELLGTRRG